MIQNAEASKQNRVKQLKSLSAEYEFTNTNPNGDLDEIAERLHPEVVKEKFTYDPRQYDYPEEDGKGYSFTRHDPLKSAQDETFANHTFVGLNASGDMSSMAVKEDVDILNLVLFTTLKAPNGKYLKNINGNLFAVTEPDEIITDANMFKIYRNVYSGKGYDIHNPEKLSYVISQGQKFATVKMFMNRFNIEMKELISGDPTGIQHFRVYQIPGTNRISIYSMMDNPWQPKVNGQEVEDITNNNVRTTLKDVHRFWSIYDGVSSDLSPNRNSRYPTYIYESSVPWPNMVKLNGNVFNNKYVSTVSCPCECLADAFNAETSYIKGDRVFYGDDMYVCKINHRGPWNASHFDLLSGKETFCSVDHNRSYYNKNGSIDTLERVGNNYLFEAGYLADDNDRYIMIGYDGKIRWVKYFNEFYDKFFNSDVTPDKIIEDVKPSIVHECPYKAAMDENGFKLNFVELKNVMTPGYDYTAFDKPILK